MSSLPTAVLELETPSYVYDLAEVRHNATALSQALPEGSLICYSLKANPHPLLQQTLREHGAWAEVCSRGEVDAALAAGFHPDHVLYTGPGKRDTDVRHALGRGVREFSVDSPTGLAQLDRLAGEAGVTVRCLLRINDDTPARGQGLTMTGVPSQFGADAGWVLAQPERFTGTARARVVGLHLYMGTNLNTVTDLLGQFEQALATASRLRDALSGHGVVLDTLDLGGGFGAPFARVGALVDLTGLREGLVELLDRHASQWRDGRPRLVFESGRYLVGTAGTLLTRVLDSKRSQGQQIAVLESGINHLGGMSGLRRLPPLTPHLLDPSDADPSRTGSSDPAQGAVPTLVTGPLCTPLDVWNRSAALAPLAPGRLLAVPNVGAYGLYASLLAFLGHPVPTEIVLDTDLESTRDDGADLIVDVSRLEFFRVPRPLPTDPEAARPSTTHPELRLGNLRPERTRSHV